MSELQTTRVDSIDELRQHAAAWDDLWRRSCTTRPVARADTVAQWIEHFAPAARFSAVVVCRGDRWVAALPLIGQKVGGWIDAGCLPHNAWSPAGDLLLDQNSDSKAVLSRLAEGLRELPWKLLWLDGVPVEAAHWSAFRAAVAARGLPHLSRHRFDVGMIDVQRDWQTCRQRWSRNHRRNITKALARLQRAGRVEFEWHEAVAANDVESLLRRGFEVEDSGWKGRAGTSVLRSDGMFEFFASQARLLAAEDQLRVALLNLDGRPIAFEYGLSAKATYHGLKVGFDERYCRYSPGQLLTHFILQHLSRERDSRHYDCMGPLSGAMQTWKPRAYPLGRIAVAPPSLLGRLTVHAYQHWWPRPATVLPSISAGAC